MRKIELSIRSLKKEMKPEKNRNFEFAYRERPILTALFEIVGLSEI